MPVEAANLVRRYYVYSGTYTLGASVIWGINTLFLLDAGLSIGQVFIANSAFSLGTFLFEIPTGVVADTAGRRVSFLFSLVVLATTTVMYVGLAQIGGGVIAFSVVSALMGLGFTFYSGAMEAWLVDGVRFHGYEGNLDHVFSRAQMVGGGAMIIGTIGGGFLGQLDLAIPFVVRAVLLLSLFGMAYRGMHDRGFEPRRIPAAQIPSEAARIGSAGIRLGWKNPTLRLLIVGAGIQNGFFMWAWYAWQPYFLELLGRNLVWVSGLVAALLSLAMMAGNALVEVAMRVCGRRTTLLLATGIGFGGAAIGVGAATTFPLALVFLVLACVAIGIQMPVRQAFVHEMVPSEHRATVISFDSMIGGGMSIGGQTGLGALAERNGYSAGYAVGGAVALLAIPIMWMVRRQDNPSDFYFGRQAGAEATCTPIGLPEVATVAGAATTEAG